MDNYDDRFAENERAVLHSLAEMFADKRDRDELRKLVNEGATLRQLILAYRSQRLAFAFIKGLAGFIVIIGGAAAMVKGSGIWPGK